MNSRFNEALKEFANDRQQDCFDSYKDTDEYKAIEKALSEVWELLQDGLSDKQRYCRR